MIELLDPKHRKNAREKGIYLNIYQPAHDLKLAAIARKMRNAGIFYDTFSSMSGLTVVVTKGEKKKVGIYNLEDLKPYAAAEGKSMSEFARNNKTADSAVGL